MSMIIKIIDDNKKKEEQKKQEEFKEYRRRVLKNSILIQLFYFFVIIEISFIPNDIIRHIAEFYASGFQIVIIGWVLCLAIEGLYLLNKQIKSLDDD